MLAAAPRQFGEETLHGVHPGTGSGGKVKVPVGVSLQPRRVLARSCGWRNCPESRAPGSRPGSLRPGCPGKPGTPAGGVSPGSGPGPVRSAHSGRQRGWWYHAGCIHGSGWRGLSRVQGQAGLGALQGLDLRLLMLGLHQGMRQMRCTVVWSRPTACSMRRLAQWEAPSGGGCSVRVSTSCICVSETSGGVRSRNRPSPRPPHNAPASATPRPRSCRCAA